VGGHASANVTRFDGVAETYDKYRPVPPPAVADVVAQYAGIARPRLVVDIGCGTGLSTRLWSGRAERVIGIEPNADMRREARRRTATLPDAASFEYREGVSTQTCLPDGCADIVTVSQALHWMEPKPTFVEIARILRGNGVFAAYDCDTPPACQWQAEMAYGGFMSSANALGRKLNAFEGVTRWSKDEHLTRIRKCGLFRFTREVLVHYAATGGADDLVGLALSHGHIATLFRNGVSEAELGVSEFREGLARLMGSLPIPFYYGYRVRLGVK
jgi:ubiquinone/menaquinone biosynthesis C-methylase UbiE